MTLRFKGRIRPPAVAFLACLIATTGLASATEPAPDFARDILPIFQTHCHSCHGPETQKSGYRLDIRDLALRGGDSGRPAIVPHHAADSPLLRFVAGDDPDLLMPPAKSNKARLTPDQVVLLRNWIDAGPVWPDALAGTAPDSKAQWALAPLSQPPVPGDSPHPVDAFVRAQLARKNLSASPPADPRTLLRRLSYDLTGLPPSPQELQDFLSDTDPHAYDRAVARLLASPRHGEQWARHWLDVANYADTHGNDHDYARPNAWPYRDYVIRAFNEDKPYPRFIQEQIAGDTLFPDDPQATVALGFLAAGPWDHTLMVTVREDTTDHRMSQYLDRDNMVSTAIGTVQSLTIHCARCHNHKFDPISQREYYGLQAVFAGVDRAERPFDADPGIHRERQRLLRERRTLDQRTPGLLASLDSTQVIRRIAEWERDWSRREKAWKPLDLLSVVSTGGASLTRQTDGSWLAGGTRPEKDTYILTARIAETPRAFRLEVLPDERLPQRGPGRWDNGNFHLSEFKAFVSESGTNAAAVPIVFASATADFDEGPSISAAQAIDGKNETHWGVHPRYGEPHEAVFEVKNPPVTTESSTFTFLLENQAGAPGHGIGRFRLTATEAAPAEARLKPVSAELRAVLHTPASQRTPEQRQSLALAVLRDLNQRALAALPSPRMVYAVTQDFPADGPNFKPSPQPRPIHVLARGDLGKPGEEVGPGALGCIPGMPAEFRLTNPLDEASRRAALAQWLTDPGNVLTWRSIVNRVWSHHFGRGLCDTPNDFGRMGGIPSHPELLDWLAVWFRDEARGSLKALHRLIVTSDTWKQSSIATQGAALDTDNRLLWRQNRVRLTAEQVRDSLLTLSGQIDLTMGGPSAIQFLERGDATFMSGGNPAYLDYEHFDPDAPAARRRAIYRFLFRTVPDPFMDALDAPDGGTFTPVRSTSSTAQQAFAFLNDRFLIRQCQHLAERIAARCTSPDAQAEAAFQAVLQRATRVSERTGLAAYIQRHGLANATQLLLNSNEFLYLD